MKAVRFHQTGGPEVLVLEDVPIPTPGAGEILIRVEAAGINYADAMRRNGDPYAEPSPTPYIPGIEVAGTIEAHGPGVRAPAVGTSVFASPERGGGYAQYVVASAARVMPLPAGLTPVQATTLVVQGLTAALVLRHAGRLAVGETVAVEAAAGGVGSFAVQLGKLFGASQVIGLASDGAKCARARQLGADAAIDYTDPRWPRTVRRLTGGRGTDLLLEMTRGVTLSRALQALAPFGRMVVYGQASRQTAHIATQRLVVPNHSITGFYLGAYIGRRDLIRSTLEDLIGYVLDNRLELQVGAVLPLARASEAHRLLEGRKTTGKVVLQPWAEEV
jgi:NADPH2:quinone reductase